MMVRAPTGARIPREPRGGVGWGRHAPNERRNGQLLALALRRHARRVLHVELNSTVGVQIAAAQQVLVDKVPQRFVPISYNWVVFRRHKEMMCVWMIRQGWVSGKVKATKSLQIWVFRLTSSQIALQYTLCSSPTSLRLSDKSGIWKECQPCREYGSPYKRKRGRKTKGAFPLDGWRK